MTDQTERGHADTELAQMILEIIQEYDEKKGIQTNRQKQIEMQERALSEVSVAMDEIVSDLAFGGRD